MKKSLYINFLTLGAAFIGALAFFWPSDGLFQVADVVGGLFLKFLRLISLPLIFLAIISSISGMKGFDEMRLIGKKILQYTLLTTLIAASIALGLYLFLAPEGAHSGGEVTQMQGSYLSFFMNIIPDNIVEIFLQNNVLGGAFLSFVLGIGILFLKEEEKKSLHHFFKSFFHLFLKVTTGLIYLIPVGIWAFVTLFVRDLKSDLIDMKPLISYALCIVFANLIQGLLVLPVFLKSKGLSPLKAARSMAPALLTAFFSKSSNAALPITLECAEKRLGVRSKIAKLSLPLCSIINMNGCAAFILITVLFVAGQHGIAFTMGEMILWVGLASLAAVGNAGVPMGCYFLASAFLVGMNVPLTLMGLILPFYSLLDMVETALNVWSDSCITQMVDEDLKKIEAPAFTEA